MISPAPLRGRGKSLASIRPARQASAKASLRKANRFYSCQPLKHALKSIRCFCRRCHFRPRFVFQKTFVASSDCTKLCAAFMARFSSGSILLATSG